MTTRGTGRNNSEAERIWRSREVRLKMSVMSGHPLSLPSQIQNLLSEVEGQSLEVSVLAQQALRIAPLLHRMCESETSHEDREHATMLSRMMTDRRGQVFTTLLTDRAYRSASKTRAVEQARYLLQVVGAPTYVGSFDRMGLRALRSVGSWFPSLTAAAMLRRIRRESSAFVLPDDEALDGYLRHCADQGIDVNVNRLGEEVLGEEEAERRVDGYIDLLERAGIETLSVKASSIASQLDALAFERSVSTLTARLVRICRAAQEFRRADGAPKLVVLDMEAYRDVGVTVEAFKRVLGNPELLELGAGIALQTYLPETLDVFESLGDWAHKRTAQGGAPIRVRLVKGANLAMERVEASLYGWRVPIFSTKAAVDANFKRVLVHASRAPWRSAVHVGLASHNLFDVCFGLVLRSSAQLGERLSFELLHGMAGPLQRSLQQLGASVLVYAPIVGEQEFPSAIAYLVRRLDENTATDNYLRHSFGMRAGTDAWKAQAEQFLGACALATDDVNVHGRGIDRRKPRQNVDSHVFVNEADTDFSASGNRVWIDEHLNECWRRSHAGEYTVHPVIDAKVCTSGAPFEGFDPSRPGVVAYRGVLATPADVDEALATAAGLGARVPHPSERLGWLRAAAAALTSARGELISLMVLDAGKRVVEADAEVSEAIDFARYYATSFAELELDAARAGTRLTGLGPVVVTPPWNFPLAIPVGGIFAALCGGNPVILKPALETPLVASRACEILWGAGVPRDWLQLVVCEDEVGSRLITDPRTRAVILTGGTATARKFLSMRPRLRLFAETGGKNALYVSDMSDRELAISDVVRSAFGHAGQKCSALSQLILHEEVFNDRSFQAMLADAASSMKVGSAWDLASAVTPMIAPPNALQRDALTQLTESEQWLVEPRIDPENPRLVSPGIKWGVKPHSLAHTTEFFCPLLSVLCASSLDDAVRIANATSYGLTAGIHSLDEREQAEFSARMQAGNLYVNRPVTGAIVRRQPFGGWKDSAFGPGAKAGGPNYVGQFVSAESVVAFASASARPEALGAAHGARATLETLGKHVTDAELHSLAVYAASCSDTFAVHFERISDVSLLHGEENVLRYRTLREVGVWVTHGASAFDVARVAVALATCGCSARWYSSEGASSPALIADLGMTVLSASEAEEGALIEYVAGGGPERLRVLGECSASVLAAANQRNVAVIQGPPSPLPRLELIGYLREQAVSTRYHRYGHLGMREVGTGP